MLSGKRISPNDIFKSTADYVKEAKAEAYEDAAKIADTALTGTGVPTIGDQIRTRAKELIGK